MSETLGELRNRLQKTDQEKQGRNCANRVDDDIVAIIEKLLENECITKTQHKNCLIKLQLI